MNIDLSDLEFASDPLIVIDNRIGEIIEADDLDWVDSILLRLQYEGSLTMSQWYHFTGSLWS